MELIPCWDCAGVPGPRRTLVCRVRGSARTEVGWEFFPCPRCGGVGVVPEQMKSWVRRGQRIRGARLRRRESVWVAAVGLGLKVMDYVRMECGLASPGRLERAIDGVGRDARVARKKVRK